MGGNRELGTQAVEKRRWGQSLATEEIVERGTEKGRRERGCECPRGECESGHPSLLWPGAVLPATTSHSHHILTAGPQMCTQTLFTGNPATARTENKLNHVPGSPLLRTTSLRLPLTRLAKHTVCIYNRWCPYMEIHPREWFTPQTCQKEKSHYSLQAVKTGHKTAALDGIDVCDFWHSWFYWFIVLFII